MKALWNGFGLISVGFLMMTSEACKMKESQASDLEGAKKTVSWEELKPGQKFRMSPADQSSKCYLPSGNGLALGNCGDQEYWVVVRAVNPYIKQVKSQIDNKCLQFVDKSLRAVECTDDAKPSDKNSWGDDFFSPLQHQYLSVSSDRLVPAYRRVCNVVGSRMRTGGKCSVVAEPTLFEGYSDSVTFSIGSESPSPDDKLIYRSKVIQARDERHTGSFASEIRWGHIPRIKSILVATQGEPYANKNNAWITGIQIHYASGEKFLIGNCALDQSGNCVVENSDHPKYPNPIAFDTDEYITSVGMKFGPGSIRADRMILEHAKDTRLIEFIIKTNKNGKKLHGKESGMRRLACSG